MTAQRCLIALAVLLGHTAASAQIVVPLTWKQMIGTPEPDSEIVACTAQAGALFRVAFDGPRLTASVMKGRDRPRDPVPYELDWAAALHEQPAPPAYRRQSDAWASNYAREHARRVVLPVEDGYLVGFGAGEYGGSLWWYPREPGPGRNLARDVVHAIVATPESGAYIVISGVAHMGSNTGAASWVGRDQHGEWHVRSRVALRGSPDIHAALPAGILMVDGSTVDLLTWAGELRTLQRSAVGTAAASLAFGPGGEIAIGRSVLVSVLSPDGAGGYREEWFLPPECQAFTYWRELICMCAGAPILPPPL